MPPPTLINLADLDCSRVLYTREQIYQILPQRHEFAQLDGIVHFDVDAAVTVGVRDVRADEWWCRGHMPGKPIFPGVLMVECGAQLAAFTQHFVAPFDGDGFMGFGGIDQVKFRSSVVPPARIVIVGRGIDKRPRRFTYELQAFVDDAMVFEGVITGMKIKM